VSAFGDHIRSARAQRGRTLRDVAWILGISPSYLSRIERGQRRPSAALTARIAIGISEPVSDLMLLLDRRGAP
jgi:transcriptional regulator with XRE-family HTH domain